MENNRLE